MGSVESTRTPPKAFTGRVPDSHVLQLEGHNGHVWPMVELPCLYDPAGQSTSHQPYGVKYVLFLHSVQKVPLTPQLEHSTWAENRHRHSLAGDNNHSSSTKAAGQAHWLQFSAQSGHDPPIPNTPSPSSM